MPLKLIPPRNDARQSSPNWRVRGTYLGTKVDQTAGTPSKRLAAKVLEQIREEIERGAFLKPSAPDFLTAAISYLEAGGEGRFIRPLQEHFGETPLDKIDQAAIDRAAVTLYPNATPATRNRQVYSPVSAILKHAGHAKPLNRPKGAQGESRLAWLNQEQAFALLASASELQPRFGVLCTFLLYTGCRLSEALGLTVDRMDLPHGYAFVSDTKNGEPRGVFLPPIVVSVLANLTPRGESVFGYAKAGAIYNLFNEAADKAGVKIPPRVAFHIFRHTYGAWMRRHGGLDTAGLVGTGAWKSAAAARVYEHVDVSAEARKAALLPIPVV